ncbi:hypothetical protein AK812_SmicGene44325, partial [Symbiodinium microadriaticum]
VPPLVHLLAVESYGCRAQAARAVGNLCVASQEAAKRAMRAGVVRPLLAALLTEESAVVINMDVLGDHGDDDESNHVGHGL